MIPALPPVASNNADWMRKAATSVNLLTNPAVIPFKPIPEPANPKAGWVYYDSGTNKLRCYNGTVWNDLF